MLLLMMMFDVLPLSQRDQIKILQDWVLGFGFNQKPRAVPRLARGAVRGWPGGEPKLFFPVSSFLFS
ncbi:hypothetical protein D4M53_27705 [Klebsiella pneumoniae]|nr:hypothetical protein D4M53_27705 [Klebsiella pneumoniae]